MMTEGRARTRHIPQSLPGGGAPLRDNLCLEKRAVHARFCPGALWTGKFKLGVYFSWAWG